MNLLIDLGNGRMKWARSSKVDWCVGATLVLDDAITLATALDRRWGEEIERPDKVVISVVGGTEYFEVIRDWVETRWQLELQQVIPQKKMLGVTNLYHPPESLGSDRWAAMIAAWDITGGATCVVDAGTTMTVDMLNAHGEYKGGVIFPGFSLLGRALAQNTAKLAPKVQSQYDFDVAPPALGQDTVTGVSAGLFHGFLGAFSAIVATARSADGVDARIIVTGGQAEMLLKHSDLEMIHAPDLVLRGLALIGAKAA